MASDTFIKVQNVEKLLEKLDSQRLAKKTLRKAMRLAGKTAKGFMLARARAISRKLARARVKVARDGLSARVKPTAAWANTAEAGRKPGAKMPPPTALRGGFAAARAVSMRGLPARPFVAPAARDSAGAVQAIIRDAAKEIEQQWRS